MGWRTGARRVRPRAAPGPAHARASPSVYAGGAKISANRVTEAPPAYPTAPTGGLHHAAWPDRIEAAAELDELRALLDQGHRDGDHRGRLRHADDNGAHVVAFDDHAVDSAIDFWRFEYECPADHYSLSCLFGAMRGESHRLSQASVLS